MTPIRIMFMAMSVVWAQAQPVDPGRESVPATEALASLDWLAGVWRGPFQNGEWEAAYTAPTGGEILSADKEIAAGKVVMIEFERFRIVDDAVVMTPYPHGRKSDVSFTLTDHDPGRKRAVFTNPAHDFPNRIAYERVAEDRLTIEVSGEQRGKPTKLVLKLSRRKEARLP